MTTEGLRVSRVLAVGVGTLLVCLALLRLTGFVPPAPTWLAGLVLALLAAFVVGAGWAVRRTRLGRLSRPVPPLRAARTLVLAQAGALTGSLMAGWYAAQAVVLLPDLDVDSQRSRVWLLVALAGTSVVLAVAGLISQALCRIPPEQRGPDQDEAQEETALP